jgi:RNA-directed DNA polymerase
LGNLATPKRVQKLQTALHAKAKAAAGYRFYALYDKISRADILAHAYALCRSNKGAPGVDGQNFADIEAYGVERWLAELALALRQETYRPEPIRRVFIPKANGKLRPLGISTVRDRVCMTAAMLVLEPIFEADLPPEIYAYRAGRNAQQAVVEVEELLFRGHPDGVDADLADYSLMFRQQRPARRSAGCPKRRMDKLSPPALGWWRSKKTPLAEAGKGLAENRSNTSAHRTRHVAETGGRGV